MRIIGIVPGFNTIHLNLFKEKLDHRTKSLCHYAFVPPSVTNAVADLHQLTSVIFVYHCDGTYRLIDLF